MLVEDDISIVEMLTNHLAKEGFHVTAAHDGEEGVTRFRQDSFDMIVVDLMMPKLDGMEVIKLIRATSSIPILIMSAKDSDVDKALGLGFGADDYIAKPFSLIELTARIKAGIRRATAYSHSVQQEERGNVLTFEQLTVDLDNFSAMKQDEDIKLTSKEFDILKLFITNPNRVFTKAQIYGFVWNDDYMGDENVINVHIRRLREKIEDNPSEPKYIKTLWGIGYKWAGH
ncbi:response regulator transcription factor [Paenibacillus apiarius]|uniref:Response regulator transcription factor n=1 Tax=Paenibacillus apiarius TaxID=46240 RepID=A0ABT4DRV5_9BACL|nr:response regulator transcription factor [Paenibacillus apiarius]MCY9514329.1 response regulator transcription factor [Paenibacillus apiarius]MCY9520088.1 response regulator transcription factor [Paenibacillus apiarius]MCY9550095.1 response regulator transcription factor [Paenibacillus apiarius]MCY9560294.1 response regulator transcription factor [Paenibacillus apiarius]